MKRQIIFRGQSLANGKWIEGNLFVKGSRCTITDDCSCYSVDPETVGQWTGLTDRAGQRIFEDDIIRWRKFADKEYQISIMKWFEQFASFGLTRSIDDGAMLESDWFGIVFWGGDMELIGDIWDSKDLLKTE